MQRQRTNALDFIVAALVIIGGINWGLVGLFDFNLVEALFGAGSLITQSVYILVGIAALYMVFSAYKVTHPVQMAHAGEDHNRKRY